MHHVLEAKKEKVEVEQENGKERERSREVVGMDGRLIMRYSIA